MSNPTPDSDPQPERMTPDEEDATGWIDLPDDPEAYPETHIVTAVEDPALATPDLVEYGESGSDGLDVDEGVSRYVVPRPAELRPLLTDERVRMIRALQEAPAASKAELAERLGRNPGEVSQDLDLLAEYNIVRFRDGEGRARAPFIPYDTVRVGVDLSAEP